MLNLILVHSLVWLATVIVCTAASYATMGIISFIAWDWSHFSDLLNLTVLSAVVRLSCVVASILVAIAVFAD